MKATKGRRAAATGAKSASKAKAERPSGKEVDPLAAGRNAPDFDLPDDSGGRVRLEEFAGRKLVIFFYPRADTPGCTLEAKDFTRLAKDFSRTGTALLGVSADPQKAQARFRDKHDLGVPLASDEDHEMLRAYGAWGAKSMYGRTFEGVLRSTVLIGPDGRVAHLWRNVKVEGHAEEVLAAARDL